MGIGVCLLLTFLVFLASDMLRPAVNTWLSKMAGDEQGFIAGMSSAYMSLGNVTGPVLAGLLFEQDVDFPYMCAGIVLLACFVLSFVPRKEPRGTSQKGDS
ncbi:MFS transporter [Paenibacillus sp. P25]|nr:MFS transporter [Paenibacillus sp. P25]